MRGILPDGFYFHREVGVKLSAESENERGGDQGREQKRGLTRTSRRTTSSVGGEGWGSQRPLGCPGNSLCGCACRSQGRKSTRAKGWNFYQEDKVKIRSKGRMDQNVQAAWKECEARRGR